MNTYKVLNSGLKERGVRSDQSWRERRWNSSLLVPPGLSRRPRPSLSVPTQLPGVGAEASVVKTLCSMYIWVGAGEERPHVVYGWELTVVYGWTLDWTFSFSISSFKKNIAQPERHLAFQTPEVLVSTPHGRYPPPLCPLKAVFQKVIPGRAGPSSPSSCPQP